MQIPPLDVILQWPTPNYVDPVTRGSALLVIMILFSILVVLAVAGRFYSRLTVQHWYGWDDSMILLALIFTIGMNASVILANRKYGWDRHIWDLPLASIQNANIVAFVAKLAFVEASTFTRMSLVFFYYRLVKDSGIAWFTWVLHASMFFIVSLGIAFTCLGIWLCIPVQAYWVFPPSLGYKCLDEGTATLIVGILNSVADLLTTILPIPLIMRLKMPLRHRIGVSVLLGLGVLVTVAGVVRTYYIWKSLISSWDETWFSYPLWICAAVEIDVAVICACAPALKPLLHKSLAQMSSRISSKFRSPETTRDSTANSGSNDTRSSNMSTFWFRFRHRYANDSVWDGDEEYGMLRLDTKDVEKKDGVTAVHLPAASDHDIAIPQSVMGSWTHARRPTGPTRPPTLEIVKRQSVDQEISYLNIGEGHTPPHAGQPEAALDFR